jgi:hypothetical protein
MLRTIFAFVVLTMLFSARVAGANAIAQACQLADFEATFAQVSSLCTKDNPHGFPGNAFASADLATGDLRAKAVGNADNNAGASASFSDTITIHGSLAVAVPVLVTLSVVGFISGPANSATDNNGEVSAGALQASNALGFNGDSLVLKNYLDQAHDLTDTEFFKTGTGGVGITSLAPADVHYTIHDVALVDLANPTVTITASVSALADPVPHAIGEEVTDFADTAALSIVLPAGYTFTSASGVLLTGAPTTTAEPPPLALLAGAIAALCWVRSRFRAARASTIA